MNNFAIPTVGPVIGDLDSQKIYEWVQDNEGSLYLYVGLFDENRRYGPNDLANGDLILHPNLHYRRIEWETE
ncbi:hypothetical protein RYZ26_06845 [Terasakiella sp. A23]|uniref:hypothetical protein n=1 Tax=Terasakiella sp. FCG-A23 TaxID=3080561 RepID=UPI002955AA12|nr:hypothetical protein [Terasakiella sp. A23]MDV7339303.1 hypothetical protein [Terasakiella sp. A23]